MDTAPAKNWAPEHHDQRELSHAVISRRTQAHAAQRLFDRTSVDGGRLTA